MDAARATTGEKIAAGSAVALFVTMFLPWYGVSLKGGGVVSVDTFSAWQAFSLVDILLFLAAATVVALVVADAAGSGPQLPAPPGLIMLGAGGLALALVLFRLLFAPDLASIPEDFDVTRKLGIFVALLACGGMVYGATRANREM